MTATCQYCHATLPHHVSLATHYAACTVLAYCLGPESPFPGKRIVKTEKASRANEQHEIVLVRARAKAEKHG